MRFVGQAFEVPVLFEEAELESLDAAGVHRRFGEAHQRVYFFGGEAAKPIEFVSFRLGVTAPLDELPLLAEDESGGNAARVRSAVFDGKAWQRRAPACAARRSHGTSGHLGPGADRGPDLDPLSARRLDGPVATTTTTPSWSGSDHAGTRNRAAVRARTDATLDPVDYAVISQALIAIAREMGTKLIRSSYSNIVREAQDASAALFDAHRQCRGRRPS